MKRRITLLVATAFVCSFVFAQEDEESTDNEKTWSIGIGKNGVSVDEVEPNSNAADEQSTVGAGRTKWMGGQRQLPLDQDSRWYVGNVIESSLDVDVAYARLKREFEFDTTEERLANTPAVRGHVSALHQGGFLHEAEPGAHYVMRDRTDRTADRIVQIEIFKETSGSQIEFGFAKHGLTDVSSYALQIHTRIVNAVDR